MKLSLILNMIILPIQLYFINKKYLKQPCAPLCSAWLLSLVFPVCWRLEKLCSLMANQSCSLRLVLQYGTHIHRRFCPIIEETENLTSQSHHLMCTMDVTLQGFKFTAKHKKIYIKNPNVGYVLGVFCVNRIGERSKMPHI